MCVAFFQFGAHENLLFLLLFNRDEHYNRPTQPTHFWPDVPSLIGGRDGIAKGTWLGVSKKGRVSFLTNCREVHGMSPCHPPSRGALPTQFLKGEQPPLEYLLELEENASKYPGFNLVVYDAGLQEAAYFTNRDHVPEKLEPGFYGLSNGKLQEWPKVRQGTARLENIMKQQGCAGPEDLPWERLFSEVLGDKERVTDPALLPHTGYGEDEEESLSAVFVEPVLWNGDLFGTRSQTVVAMWRTGLCVIQERFTDESGTWQHVQHSFQVDRQQPEESAAPAAASHDHIAHNQKAHNQKAHNQKAHNQKAHGHSQSNGTSTGEGDT